ncbi:MAG: glycosyltransferase family 4 protein [Ignavibacteriae bacterium]|nr:glycosyltransferase family 4 protein [Ignavibacteriota bacterium]
MKILLLSRYGSMGASSRYRSYQYVPLLRKQGWDITVAPLLDDTYVRSRYFGGRISLLHVVRAYTQRVWKLLRAKQYDLIWLEYEALPWIPNIFESLLFGFKVPYVVDYDDAVFHRYDQHPCGIIRRLLGKKINRVMSGSSMVIAGNEYIAERAYRVGALRVEILPTVVDLNRYPLAPLSDNGMYTIGWIGSPMTSHYLKIIQPALEEISRTVMAKVVAVGAGALELMHVPLEVRPWSETTEVQEIQKLQVGIMPLPDSPWERGKCGLKLIQYMACGKPVVASPVGVNTQLVEHGVNGFLASSQDDWLTALTTLGNNGTLRRQMGMAGRKKVETHYCLQVTAPKLLQLLCAAKERGRKSTPC